MRSKILFRSMVVSMLVTLSSCGEGTVDTGFISHAWFILTINSHIITGQDLPDDEPPDALVIFMAQPGDSADPTYAYTVFTWATQRGQIDTQAVIWANDEIVSPNRSVSREWRTLEAASLPVNSIAVSWQTDSVRFPIKFRSDAAMGGPGYRLTATRFLSDMKPIPLPGEPGELIVVNWQIKLPEHDSTISWSNQTIPDGPELAIPTELVQELVGLRDTTTVELSARLQRTHYQVVESRRRRLGVHQYVERELHVELR